VRTVSAAASRRASACRICRLAKDRPYPADAITESPPKPAICWRRSNGWFTEGFLKEAKALLEDLR
jgi:hypothetical protein